MLHYPDDLIRAVFARTRTIAVVGLSPDPSRPSHRVAGFLQREGFRVVPVNPRAAGDVILGEPVHSDLESLPASLGDVEMVDIFRRSEEVGPVVDAALAHLAPRGLRTVWMQLGVIDRAAAARAEAAGVTVVMDRCPAIEIPRLRR